MGPYKPGKLAAWGNSQIVPWQQKFSMTVHAKDNTMLMRLFENEEGLLDVEWNDPPRQTEAAEAFIAGVTQLWNSLR